MMFNVIYKGFDDEVIIKPLLSGLVFGFINKKLIFEVTIDGIALPLTVNFEVKIDENRKPFELNPLPIKDNIWNIYFYNPSRGNPSGAKSPFGFGLPNDATLLFIFMVDMFPESTSFRLTYEFFEEKK